MLEICNFWSSCSNWREVGERSRGKCESSIVLWRSFCGAQDNCACDKMFNCQHMNVSVWLHLSCILFTWKMCGHWGRRRWKLCGGGVGGMCLCISLWYDILAWACGGEVASRACVRVRDWGGIVWNIVSVCDFCVSLMFFIFDLLKKREKEKTN